MPDRSLPAGYYVGLFPQYAFDYNANGLISYYGIARKGKLTSDAVWLIEQYLYDGNNNLTSIKTSNLDVIWDNRACLTYY